MICPKCKTENDVHAKFCRNCGEEINATDNINYIPSTSFKASSKVGGFPFKNYRYYRKELFKQFSWIEEKEYPRFAWKYDLSWNYLFIKKNDCIGLFDVFHLRVAIPPIYKTVEYFVGIEGQKCFAIIQSVDGKYGLFNIDKMKIIIPVQYDFLEWNDEKCLSLKAIEKGEKIMIDNKGNILE